MPSWGLSKYIKTKLQTTCFYSYKAFLKNKKRSGFYDVTILEINLVFLIKPFFLHDQKVKTKI